MEIREHVIPEKIENDVASRRACLQLAATVTCFVNRADSRRMRLPLASTGFSTLPS